MLGLHQCHRDVMSSQAVMEVSFSIAVEQRLADSCFTSTSGLSVSTSTSLPLRLFALPLYLCLAVGILQIVLIVHRPKVGLKMGVELIAPRKFVPHFSFRASPKLLFPR